MKRFLQFALALSVVAWSAYFTPQVSMATQSQKAPASISPSMLYGTWEIYRTQKVAAGHLRPDQDAQAEIGKKIIFQPNLMSWPPHTLFFDGESCKNARYKPSANTDPGPGLQANLENWEKSKAEARGDSMGFTILCNNKPFTWVEVTKNNELAFYYDGYLYFCRNLKAAK